MKICIVRHGETNWNRLGRYQGRADIPLNETGKEQIKKAAGYLKKYNWDEIITSPLLRAKQSAEIIAEEIKKEIIHEDEGFIEIDVGEIAGMTAEEKKISFPDGNFKGMEPFEELQKRVVDSIIKYGKKYFDKNIIIVSHGAAINSLLSYLTNDKIGRGIPILKNACINLLEYNGEEFKIICYNKDEKELNDEENDRMEEYMIIIRYAEITDYLWLKEHDSHINEKTLEKKIDSKEIYIVQANEKKIGWLRYNLFWDNVPFMNMLHISEGYRNKGTGRRLVKYWEESMKRKGYKNVLTSTQSNEDAQDFYRKIGYTEIGGFKYSDDPYEIIFYKEITG